MNRRRTPGVVDGLLGIGLVVSLIGLLTNSIPLTELAAIVTSFATEQSASPVVSALPMTTHGRPGDHAAGVTITSGPLKTILTSPSGRIMDRHDRGGQSDARTYLEEAAAVARRYPWAGPWRGETRTDLWVNAPEFIGSTSPHKASLVNHSVEP
jgi:hypothetical protein